MKKLNSKGFTLIELLAVITIMGILMLVAIPAVSRTIENSRRDTFMDTGKAYINAVKNAVAADELWVGSDPISAKAEGCYYYSFDTSTGNSATDLMEQGGKSSWGNANVKGYIVAYKTVDATSNPPKTTYEYGIRMIDVAKRGIIKLTKDQDLARSSVVTASNEAQVDKPAGTSNDKWEKLDGTEVTLADSNCTALTIK